MIREVAILSVILVFVADQVYSSSVGTFDEEPDLAMQTYIAKLLMVFDALEQQGRRALLPDATISAILSQLTVQVTYEPLECKDVQKDPKPDNECQFSALVSVLKDTFTRQKSS
ncbi:hypothetical protein KIN20_016307 [Parelaphostrongylus tenuis]|uniref:Uncharacterized protein n=1 Tax=Parelaphostrongylus tenuis TaxID=148309 RepID=A0AAD5MG84_PARTN|nr:hypothetical protein KIN20_016307 [Parelaphostrongylus tenuis]